MATFTQCNRCREHGVALITGLLILMIMTIIGVTAMRSTLLEERMAGNLKDQNVAFQAAEAALRVAENYLGGASLGAFVTDTSPIVLAKDSTGLYLATMSPTHQRWEQAVWDDAGSVSYPRTPDNLLAATVTPAGAAEPPRYIIEDMTYSITCSGSNLDTDCSIARIKRDRSGSLKSGATSSGRRYRITARGVGTSPNTVVYLQSYYYR